jgi:hypothetical protein
MPAHTEKKTKLYTSDDFKCFAPCLVVSGAMDGRVPTTRRAFSFDACRPYEA